MKKLLPAIALGLLITCTAGPAGAQDKKSKEPAQKSTQSTKERHKKFWTKVGKDQRDFWKGEHERHTKKQNEKKAKKAAKH